MADFTWPQVAALAILVIGVGLALYTNRVEVAVLVALVQAIGPSILAKKGTK